MKTIFKLLFVLLGIITLLYAQVNSTKVVAIPLFANHTGDIKNDWLNEALADMLTTDIASINSIAVVDRLHLKKLLKEQELSQTGLIKDEEKVLLGKMVGAKQILTGSYTIIGDKIRIDAQIFNPEKGVALGAASVKGELDEIFIIEKKLALKVLAILQIEISDEEKIQLFQIESNNSEAIKNNYKGILALENKKVKSAQDYFTKAVSADPYYKSAKSNLDAMTIDVKGTSLFADAIADLNSKTRQLNAIKTIVPEFINSVYVIKIKGDPEIISDANDPDNVDIKINFTVDINPNAVKNFIKELQSISNGDKNYWFQAKKITMSDRRFEFSLFKENFKYIKDNYHYYHYSYSYYPNKYLIRLLANNQVVSTKELILAYYDLFNSDITDSRLYCNLGSSRHVPIDISYVFKDIPINIVKTIDKADIIDKDELIEDW